MAGNVLGISVTGLKFSQSALQTVGHNIANAATEGYSRQRINAVTNPETLAHGAYFGNGVKIDSVERIVNQFVVDQMRSDSSLMNQVDVQLDQLKQLDDLLSSEETGLSSSLNSFFNALQNGTSDPASIPARQLVITETENLAERFNSISNRFDTLAEGVENGIQVAVNQINALASNIAELNLKISNARGVANGASPNDLLDQRDQAIKGLSELVSVHVFDQGNDQLNVLIGTGQSLVIGTQARSLEIRSNPYSAAQNDIIFKDGHQSQVVTTLISGGKLGGLVEFREQTLANSLNQLGRVAITLADTMNAMHQKGLDLNEQFGGLLFNDLNSDLIAENRVIANSANLKPNDRVLALTIQDSQKLLTSDYEVSVEAGGLYNIKRLSDKVVVNSGVLAGRLPEVIEFDGLELSFKSGTFQAGDRYLLQPTRHASRDITAVIQNPEELAFASPLSTDAALGNTGTGKISAGQIVSLTTPEGEPLPIFNELGKMSPPFVVVFTSPTTYDILDNSDPGAPRPLNPPIRDQRYIPGHQQALFSNIPGQTQISTDGVMLGLPEGRKAVTQAALLPAGIAPNFAVTDFSSPANQFSFDLVITGSVNASQNTTLNLTVDSANLTDTTALIGDLNSQLLSSDVRAYLSDTGQLGFKLNRSGYGDISLQNYSGGTPGQATALLGFDLENNTFTTQLNDDGISGDGLLTNGYPAEVLRIQRPSNIPGSPIVTEINTRPNASAREIAGQLSSFPGVQANAVTYAELSQLQLTLNEPLQISVNGENLLEYTPDATTGLPVINDRVPDPVSQEGKFYDYLASKINENKNLQSLSIYAVVSTDTLTGKTKLRITGSEGDDLHLALSAQAGESLRVGDGEHSPLALTATGSELATHILVGGQIDVTLDEGIELSSLPPDSMLFGDPSNNVPVSTYHGIQAYITGAPKVGDRFTLDFNNNAHLDNRNGLNLVNLQQAKTSGLAGGNFSQTYGTLVENIGIQTNSAKINREASEKVMQQTEALHNSISGVNLDEEAADLIKYQHLYSANAQVISVSRELIDKLLNIF